ncbi:MAG: hypothetical protein KKF50_05185 [Nanoarchaeota archaeon]|nr:hypothetical protein [Nanoarchaeota archaeon]
MVIQWIVLGVLIILGLWYLKMEHHTRRVKIIVIVIIGILIYFSMVGIFSSEKVNLTSPRGVVNGVYVYFGWIGQTASNLWDVGTDTVRTVGNAIKINNNSEKDESRARLRNVQQ